MEKISVNEVLALLLPGLFTLFGLQFLLSHAVFIKMHIVNQFFALYDKNDFLSSAFYLLLAVIVGAGIHRLNAIVIDKKWYNPQKGLYKKAGYFVNETDMLQTWLSFYNKDCKSIFGHEYNGADIVADNATQQQEQTLKIQGRYFDYIFYTIIGTEKGNEARTQQNYYFLFRSLYTACYLLAATTGIVALIAIYYCTVKKVLLLVLLLIVFLLLAEYFFKPMGVWYRKRMIRVLFYLYYLQQNAATTTKIN